MNITPPSSSINTVLSPIGKSLSTSLGLGAGAATAITLGLALPITLGLGLLAAHDKRVKQAKDENEALNLAMVSFDSDIQQVFEMANKGALTANDAQNAIAAMNDAFWNYIKPYQMGSQPCPAGMDDVQNGCWYMYRIGNKKGCDGSKTCTAGCCVGCNVVQPSLTRALKVFQDGGGSVHVCEIVGNKYGATPRPGYDLTYVAPPIANTVEEAINNLLGRNSTSTVNGAASSLISQVVSKSNQKNLLIAGVVFVAVIIGAMIFRR